MDHACKQCGASVEDGRPFCPHCRAPQIHVQIADSVDEPTGEPLTLIPESGDFGRASLSQPTMMDRGPAVRAALKAGVLGVFLGLIPVLGVVLTGSLGVYFYRREMGSVPSAAVGSRLGGAASLVAFGINSLLIAIRMFFMHARQEYIDGILKLAQTLGYNTADPEIQAAIHNLFTPSGMALTFFFGMIFAVAVGALGGAVAALFFRPSSRP